MARRDTLIAAFLEGTPWQSWTQNRLAGDASSRRYIRLTDNDASIILMDADPNTGQSTEPFAKISNWLLDHGLCAPKILKQNTEHGLMILEDLGPFDLAKWSAAYPADTAALYEAATDIVIRLDGMTTPPDLPKMTPTIGGQMLDVTCEWYADAVDPSVLANTMSDHLARLCSPATHVALRDFHAENLIWRPQLNGLDRIGLLDFQDAFVAPRGYDLVSLLRDVRRDVDPTIAADMTARFAAATGTEAATLAPALACLGAQRNLRIVGVFARLALREGKTRYMQMIPHLWTMIAADLSHPALHQLCKVVTATLPPPEHSAIKDLL